MIRQRLFTIVPGVFRLGLTCALVVAPLLCGCQKRLSPEQYGEIIDQVPPELNQPYSLPELDKSADGPAGDPADGEK